MKGCNNIWECDINLCIYPSKNVNMFFKGYIHLFSFWHHKTPNIEENDMSYEKKKKKIITMKQIHCEIIKLWKKKYIERERVCEFTNGPFYRLSFSVWFMAMERHTAATSKDNDSPIPVLSSKRPASRGNHLLFLLPSPSNPTLCVIYGHKQIKLLKI